jgi:hypothetical protein
VKKAQRDEWLWWKKRDGGGIRKIDRWEPRVGREAREESNVREVG